MNAAIAKSLLTLGCFLVVASLGCGDDEGDDGTSEAVRRGVGVACAENSDCTERGQVCLSEFKGGMCGIADCTTSSECPEGSVCVADPELARNFCLLVCTDKPDCNVRRPAESEANCSSSLNAIDTPDGGTNDPKVCRPPSA